MDNAEVDTIEQTPAEPARMRVTFGMKNVTLRFPTSLIRDLGKRARAEQKHASAIVREVLTADNKRYFEEKKAARKKKMT